MGRPASGHVEQLPSGSFRVEVHAGTDPLTGRRLRFRQTVKTEKQAQIVLGRLLEQACAGRQPDAGVTVAELLARYMEVAELDVSTGDTYEGYIRRTILPALGSMELRKLRGPVLDMFYARLRRCGNLACTGRPFTEHRYLPALAVVPGDARPAWQQAASALRDAISRGQLAPGDELPSVRELAAQAGLATSAARRVLELLADEGFIAARQGRRAVVTGLPRAAGSRRKNPSAKGHDCARAGCVPHRCRPMSARTVRQIHSILSGARRGELCGLQWADIDLGASVMHIAFSYLARGAQKLRKDTKTHQDRSLAIDPVTCGLLAERRQQAEAALAEVSVTLPPGAYVFSGNSLGDTPWNPDWVTHKVAEIAKSAGVSLNVQALRAYTASQLLAGGIDLRNTAARLGHGGGGATTLRHYADPVSEVDRRAAAYLAQLTAPAASGDGAQAGSAPGER